MYRQLDRFEGAGWGWRGGGKGAGEARQGLVRGMSERVELHGYIAAPGHHFDPVTCRPNLAGPRETFVPVRRREAQRVVTAKGDGWIAHGSTGATIMPAC